MNAVQVGGGEPRVEKEVDRARLTVMMPLTSAL
jgi:hypothetical protein